MNVDDPEESAVPSPLKTWLFFLLFKLFLIFMFMPFAVMHTLYSDFFTCCIGVHFHFYSGAFLHIFMYVGLGKSFGLFFVEFLRVYDTSSSLLSGMLSAQNLMFSLSSEYAFLCELEFLITYGGHIRHDLSCSFNTNQERSLG